jgi:hypothetical protein
LLTISAIINRQQTNSLSVLNSEKGSTYLPARRPVVNLAVILPEDIFVRYVLLFLLVDSLVIFEYSYFDEWMISNFTFPSRKHPDGGKEMTSQCYQIGSAWDVEVGRKLLTVAERSTLVSAKSSVKSS